MKSSLKAKLIQHLAAKKGNAGFTLIELLVVIIIIGILSAIALPSFLNQANKAKQSEAKTYIGSLNRAQQAHYLEKNAFAIGDAAIDADGASAGTEPNGVAVASLGIGVPTLTTNYAYLIEGTATGVDAHAISRARQVVDNAGTVGFDPTGSPLKAYIGITAIDTVNNGDATTVAVVCGGLVSARANGGAGADGSEAVDRTTVGSDPATACGAKYEPLKQ